MARFNDMVKDELIHGGIEAYLGRRVRGLQRHPDPEVAGAMALRCTVMEGEEGAGEVIDFLISSDAPALRTTEDVVGELEECDWGAAWPPGKRR